MTGIPMERIVKPMIPFVIGLAIVLFVVAFVPAVIYLPLRLFGG